MKHTPGPWRFDTFTEHPSKDGGYFIYSPGEKKGLASLFNSGEHSTYRVDSGECRANACLMAAAPRLLGACKKALSCLAYRADNGDKEALGAVILLEQAIKEGEEEVSKTNPKRPKSVRLIQNKMKIEKFIEGHMACQKCGRAAMRHRTVLGKDAKFRKLYCISCGYEVEDDRTLRIFWEEMFTKNMLK